MTESTASGVLPLKSECLDGPKPWYIHGVYELCARGRRVAFWRGGVVALAILGIEQLRAEGKTSLGYPDGCRFTDVVAAGRHSWTLGIVGRDSLHRNQQRTLRL